MVQAIALAERKESGVGKVTLVGRTFEWTRRVHPHTYVITSDPILSSIDTWFVWCQRHGPTVRYFCDRVMPIEDLPDGLAEEAFAMLPQR